jgi:hypothetical protein
MKWLLRLVTIAMVTMTVLLPLLEYFDRWDRPGLRNDSELPAFLITLFIALVILAAAAVARRLMERQSAQTETEVSYEFVRSEFRPGVDVPVSAFISISPPLRI